MTKRIDIVVPAYNEEQVLERFHQELAATLDRLPHHFRIIFVDDGSTDRTPEVCRRLAAHDGRVRYLRLSRNFGHQAALTAGLDVADADAVITMDADLQHPPAALPVFIAAWQEGAEVVSGVRSEEAEVGYWKGVTARSFYRLLNRVSEVPITAGAPDFRLLDGRVVQAIRRLRERTRFLRGMYAWIGFRQVTIVYDQALRAAGTSKYTPHKMWGFALSAVLSFSRAPLRIATWVGAIVSLLSLLYGVYAIAQVIVFRVAIPGWASLAVLVSFLSAVQLLTMGVFGEYLGQVLDEVRARPLYVVAESSLHEGRLEAGSEPREEAAR